MKTEPIRAIEETRAREPRVVYTQAPVALGLVIAREGERCRLRVGGREVEAEIHPSVDPALLDEAAAAGAMALLDQSGALSVVGVVQTSRALTVDREGKVEAELTRLSIDVRQDALLRSAKAFVRLEAEQVELYGERVLTRAREVAKVIARLISLN